MYRLLCLSLILPISLIACSEKAEDTADLGVEDSDGGEATGGSSTGGATTGGGSTGGMETGGEETGGEETGGEETGGEETGGEETGSGTGSGTGGGTGEGAGGGTGEGTGTGTGVVEAPEWRGTLTGSIQYKSETVDPVTGELTTACDFEADLSSRPFVGECVDCEFAFKIDSEITTDGSSEDCDPYPYFTFDEDYWRPFDPVMAFSNEWSPDGPGEGSATNVLLSGVTLDMGALYEYFYEYYGYGGSYGYADGYDTVSVDEPEPAKADEGDEDSSYGSYGYYEDYEDYGDGYGYGSVPGTEWIYTEWEPIAFDIDSLPDDIDLSDLEDMATGTATFDAETGILNWTSTYTSYDYLDMFVDYSCSWDDDIGMPMESDEGDGEDATDGWDSDWDPSVDGPATLFTADGAFSCSLDFEEWEDYPVTDIDEEHSSDSDEDEDEDEDEPTVDVPDSGWGEEGWFVSHDADVDVWTVNLTAGVSTLITIDTHDAATSVDTWFYVSDPDECIVAEAYDNFDCSASDLGEGICPGTEFIPDTSGMHYVLIHGNQCAGEEATYQIGVDGPEAPSLTLIEDDSSGYIEIATQHTVTGTATVVDYGPPEEDDGEESTPSTETETVSVGE